MSILTFVGCFALFVCCADAAGISYKYTYAPEGTDWTLGDCTSPIRQSPIVLSKDVKKNFPEFSIDACDHTSFTCVVKEFGHGVVCAPNSEEVFTSGGGFPAPAKLLQFHLHWGNPLNPHAAGSEHVLDNKVYQGELHAVHQFPDGTFAVLGYFLKVDHENEELEDLFEALEDTKEGMLCDDCEFPLNDLFDVSRNQQFYRYDGSLTTPGCTEAVLWTVFKKPLRISSSQYATLSGIVDENGADVINTFRQTKNDQNQQTVFFGKPKL